MKKVICLILALAMCLSLCACGTEKPAPKADAAPAETQNTTPESEDEIAFEYPVLIWEDNNIRIELISFYQEFCNWGNREPATEKGITFRFYNKASSHIIAQLDDAYLGIDVAEIIHSDGHENPAPGKASISNYLIRNYIGSGSSALESMDDLFQLEGRFWLGIEDGAGSVTEQYYIDFSLPEIMREAGITTPGVEAPITGPANVPLVKTTEHMDIKGLCVDNSYVDEDGSPLKLVYLFYNFIATDENLSIDSKYTEMTFNGKNTYTSEHLASTASAMEYMPNYYYSSYIEDVYLGDSILVAATFYIPEGELVECKSITISDSQIPGSNEIIFYTDDIQYFGNGEEIAKAFDPAGYEQVMLSYEEADAETIKLVKSLVNGYYWSCFVNSTTYKVEFWADDNFEVSTSVGISNHGTYSVRNGYIFCTYSSANGSTIKIPYEIVDNEAKLHLVDAFDVKG